MVKPGFGTIGCDKILITLQTPNLELNFDKLICLLSYFTSVLMKSRTGDWSDQGKAEINLNIKNICEEGQI